MNFINSLTSRPYSILAIKTQPQEITSAGAFSFINAHLCEQKPQTCQRNSALPWKQAQENEKHTEKNSTTEACSNEWIPSLLQALKNKSSDSSFSFPVAKAASLKSAEDALGEKTPEERQVQEKYDNWHQEGIEKSLLNRPKRAFAEGKITLEQIVKVSFEQYLNIAADPAFENLRDVLGRDLSHWEHHANPDAERFKEIKTAISRIVNASQIDRKKLKFISNTLGAFGMSAMENNQDFRRSYMFYMHENEKSLKEKGTFFYHVDVENLFPASYQAHALGTYYFQYTEKSESSLRSKSLNLYALLLHHQTSSKPLNYKSLAMAFAHLDVSRCVIDSLGFTKFTKDLDNKWSAITTDMDAVDRAVAAVQQYGAERNRVYPLDLIGPFFMPQSFSKERFMTQNTQSMRGFCYYITMSVLTVLADKGNLDAVVDVGEMLKDFHELTMSDPIIYFRVAHLLQTANNELYRAFGTFSGSNLPVISSSLYKNLANIDQLVGKVLSNNVHGFSIVVRAPGTSHSIGVIPIKLGNNQVIHYYFDPTYGMLPCFSEAHLRQAIRFTSSILGCKDPNQLSIQYAKLTSDRLDYFKRLQANSGLKFNELNKRALSKYANSHTLSDEDWSAFFPDFNKGEKLYNKDFDSLEGDPVYKALKTDTPSTTLALLYTEAMNNIAINPISSDSLSSATIDEVLNREKLSATVDQSLYHDAAQALESEASKNQGALDTLPLERASLPSTSAQDAVSDRSRFSVSLEDVLVEDLLSDSSNRNGFSVSLADFTGDIAAERTAQDLGQSILNAVVESDSPDSLRQLSQVTSRRSRIRDAFISHFQRFGRGRDALEAEFRAMSPHFPPTTIGRFFDEISQDSISEADLNAVDLETHKINQQVNKINTKVAEILRTKGLSASDFRFSPAENMGRAGAILLYQSNNPAEKVNIDLSEHSQLASLWQEVKTAINSRSHNFVAAMTTYLSDAQRASFLGDGWKAVGHVSNTASKFLSLYALTTLGDESHFFQQSQLGGGEKALNILTMSDLVLDNGSNAASFANAAVKRLSTPSAALSKISRFTGKASNAVSLIVQGFELGFYAYAYKHAQTNMEREVAKLMVTTKSFQSALSIASMVACSAAPQMAPIFMLLGMFIAYVENAALTKTISKETANALFQQFAGELEFIRKLLENPKFLFNEEEKQITVVSADMPYSRLVVTAGGVQMTREAKPFAVEFTENFRQTTDQYKAIVFREPGEHAGLPIYDYDNMPAQYQGYKEMLQSFGRGFNQGFSLSPQNDDIGEFTGRHERGREHVINQASTNKNGTFSEEIAQRTVVASNIAECLMGEEEQATPIYTHLFANREANKAHNIVIKGHPIKPIYQSDGCTQAEVNGYSYAPRWNEINKLDGCDIAANGSTKVGSFWKTRKVKEVYRNTEAGQPLGLYKGKLAFKETSYMPHLKPSSIINYNQWKLETSWKAQTCYESPNALRVEVGAPQYILRSGGAIPHIYHFPQDEFVENLKYLHLEDDNPATQVIGHQVYGLFSDFPISNSDVDRKGSWFNIALVPDGNTFLHLYPNTNLNISEPKAAAPAKGDIHFMIPYQTFRNGRRRGQPAIVNKISDDVKDLILLPQTNQPIHIKLNDSVRRAVYIDILKELPNKSTVACGASVSFNQNGGLSLELDQISQIPLGNIASTTAFIDSQIKELKEFVPELSAKAMRIHSLDLTKTPYHQERLLDTFFLPLASIWKKALNSTIASNSTQVTDTTQAANTTTAFNVTESFNATKAASTSTILNLKDKIDFIATGWYLPQDNNIKDHSTVQKSASLMVPKIWRNNLPKEVQDIIQRMVFVGFARESMDAVPADVKSAIISESECYSYHFYDPQSRLMIKQWGATELRFWDGQDITLCSENTIPQKVFWSGSETENYTCDAVHISSSTETMGGAEGRVAIMVEGDSSKLEFAKANVAKDKKFLSYIFDKSLSGLIQRAEADAHWNPEESDIDLQNVMILVKDVKLKQEDQSTAPVQMFLLHDKEPKLALIPEGEGLLAAPLMQNYAITAAVASNSTHELSYKLFKRPLIEGAAYEKINAQLTNGTLTIDEIDLPEKSEIKPEFELIGIKNAPLNNAIICHTSEGIAMALDYDLEKTKLLGVSNDYLASKNITLNEEMEILAEYQSLVNRIGSSAFPYLNLYQSDESNPEQSSIFVNTKTAIPTLIYVPVFYQEYSRDRSTIKKQALSEELNVISDTNDVAGQTKRAVVQDVVNKKIYTVWRSNNLRPSLGDVFPYSYMAPAPDAVVLGLNQHAYTPSKDVELPKINLGSVLLLPCDKEIQKRVALGDWMLKRLNTLTLAEPILSSDYVQQILLTPSQRTAVESIKPVITQGVQGRLQLSLLMSTQDQTVTKGSELIRINLENAISADGKLDSAFVGSIKLHNTILNLEQLASKAYAEYLKTVV